MRRPHGFAALVLLGLISTTPGFAQTTSSTTEANILQLSVDPAHVVMVEGGTLSLTVASAQGELAPENITLYSNAGQLDAPQGNDAGQIVATYHLPTKLYPQVAILAAVAKVDKVLHVGWISVPLYGRGELTLDGRPGKEVSIQIGEQSFGPVKAGRDGTATVKVEVAPGYAAGMVGTTEIPLGTVPFSRILLVPQENSVAENGKGSTAIYVFAVDARGLPLEGAAIELENDAGQLSELQTQAPGFYSATLSAAELSTGQAIQLAARLAEDQDFQGEAELQVVDAPEPVAKPVAEVAKAPSETDLPWIIAGAGAGLFALSGVGVLALESTLSLSAMGNADDRELMQGMERLMIGVAALGLVGAAVGGGLAMGENPE